MRITIKTRRDTAAEWTYVNPVLSLGEMGIETDTRKIKFGDGSTLWNDLQYISAGTAGEVVAEDIDDRISELLVAGSGISLNYNDMANSLTISSSGSNGINIFDQDLNTFNNVVFNTIKVSGPQIFGDGTNSGDGNGYGTLELVPDSGLYNNDQYIIIDPTGPNHVHLRAGGTIDDSSAEIIVGGEKNNLRVNDQSPLARLQTESIITLDTYYLTSPNEFSSATWETVEGNHRVVINDPSPTIYNVVWSLNSTSLFNVIDNGNNYYELTSNGSSTPGGSDPVVVYVDQAPPSNPTTLTQITFEIRENRQTYLEASGSDIRIQAADDVRIYSNDVFGLYNYSPTEPIQIITDYDDHEYTWQFSSDGELIGPYGATIGNAGEGWPSFYNSDNSPVMVSHKNINSGAELATAIFQPSPSDNGGLVEIIVAGTGINDYEYWSFRSNGMFELASGGVKFVDDSVQNTAWTGSVTSAEVSDFNASVSGLLPVKDIQAGYGIGVSAVDGTYTIESNITSVTEASKLVTTVFNKTGNPIPKFTVVYINGGQGDQPTITKAIASNELGSSKTYGITAENIDNMSTGKVIVEGALVGVNTDQFNPTAPQGDVNGTILYLSPVVAGGVTTTKPYAPNHLVSIGTIVRTHQNEGVVEVKIQNGYELQELHNVAIISVSNDDILVYNSGTQLWTNNNNAIFSNTSGISGASKVTNMVVISQIDYDNLDSYDSNTIYYIV